MSAEDDALISAATKTVWAREDKRQMAAAKKKAASNPIVVREKAAEALLTALDRKIAPMVDSKTRQILIRDQRDAELLGSIVKTDIPAIEADIYKWFGKDTDDARKLYESLREKRDRFGKPIENRKRQYRNLITNWVFAEQKRKDEEAAERQRQIDEIAPEAGAVVQSEEVELFGFSTVKRKGVKVVDSQLLIKLIAAGEAPWNLLVAEPIDMEILRKEARKEFDSVQASADGKKYLYNGTVEIYEEGGISSRG